MRRDKEAGTNALTVLSLKSEESQQGYGSAEVVELNLPEKLMRYERMETAEKKQKVKTYNCFYCDAKISIKEYLKKRIRCPYCGSKILYKQRVATSKVKAR